MADHALPVLEHLITAIRAALPNSTGQQAWQAWVAVQGATSNQDDDQTALELSYLTFATATALISSARAMLYHRFGPSIDHFPWQQQAYFSWWSPSADQNDQLGRALERDSDPVSELGWLSQTLLPRVHRQRVGQVYTPVTVVELLLDRLDYHGAAIINQRLLDPACGAGAFLLAATRRLFTSSEAAGLSFAEERQLVSRAIYGLDRDPIAIALSEMSLFAQLAARDPDADWKRCSPFALATTDSLQLTDDQPHVAALKQRQLPYQQGFDYLVANPPYGKLPSARLNAEQQARFAATTYGHPNLYGLFFQVGVELLADQGRLGFLTPASMTSGRYFHRLRHFLTERLTIDGFDVFTARSGLFTGVLQEVMITYAHRSQPQTSQLLIRELDRPPEIARQLTTPRNSVLLDQHFDHAFFISADPLAHQLLNKVLLGTPLAQLGYQISTGTIVWNRLRESLRDQEDATSVPLCWSTGIRPFAFRGFGNRDGHYQALERSPRTERLLLHGPALLVKRLTAREEHRRLVACRLPETVNGMWAAENHVNVIRALDYPALDIDALLGLLNSRLFEYLFRALNGNTQVSATELGQLPIIIGPELAAIAALSRQRQTDPASRSSELDRQVGALYGLSTIEQHSLLECLPD